MAIARRSGGETFTMLVPWRVGARQMSAESGCTQSMMVDCPYQPTGPRRARMRGLDQHPPSCMTYRAKPDERFHKAEFGTDTEPTQAQPTRAAG